MKLYITIALLSLVLVGVVTAGVSITKPVTGPNPNRAKDDTGTSLEFPVDTLCFQGQCIDKWPINTYEDTQGNGNPYTCDDSKRGDIVFIKSPGNTPDYEEQCRKTSFGTYRWVTR